MGVQDKIVGIHRLVKIADFIMQMGAIAPAGRADITDDIITLDPLAFPDIESRKVAVMGHIAETVVDDDYLADIFALLGHQHDAVGRGDDFISQLGGDIQAVVEF